MSALPPKADIDGARWNVRFVPKADITALSELALRFSLAPLSVPPLFDPPQTENKVPGVAAKTRAHVFFEWPN
jgi:hypothetical protein